MTDQAQAEAVQKERTKNWYVVHTYSGYEQKAKLALEERIRSHKMESKFEEILVPSESVVETHKGKKKMPPRKFSPSYFLAFADFHNAFRGNQNIAREEF